MLAKLKEMFTTGPDLKWFNDALCPLMTTPDYGFLAEHQYQLLFVYDDMMHNRRKMNKSTDWFRLSGAFTRNQHLLYKKKLGTETFPIPLPAPHEKGAHIKGELWAVRPDEFLWLDKQKENGLLFERKRVHVNVPYRKVVWTKDTIFKDDGTWETGTVLKEEQNKIIVCWMYVGIPQYWNDQLDAGFLFGEVSKYSPNKPDRPDYYYFSERDYEVGGKF